MDKYKQMKNNSLDTICAISTAAGSGAIAVIRLSGNDARKITEKIFYPASKSKKIFEQPANTIHFGTIRYNEKDIDEVLVSLFKSPNSYTGEDTIEISCHGSPFIQQKIIEILIDNGCRLALPGEFTQRAFLNGKMDLSQAEAVADLISSQSEIAQKIALQQMRGGFSSELANLRERLLWFISLIELELDFSEENVEFANRNELNKLVDEIITHLSNLTNSFSLGNAIKNGVPVVIAGLTNTGKSTLLNCLLNEERAIVSEIHGTTRDAIEDVVNIDGIMFRFIDTAGIRKAHDKIENLGIQITYNKIKEAAIVIFLLDISETTTKNVEILDNMLNTIDLEKQKLIVALNKIDITNKSEVSDYLLKLQSSGFQNDIIPISAKKNLNIDKLISGLLYTVNIQKLDNSQTIITNSRHYEALSKALDSMKQVKKGLITEISGDFLAQDIREALFYIGSITGNINNDEVLGTIFRNFCIGK